MTVLLKGADTAAAMKEEISAGVAELVKNGVTPCLGLVRVGARPDDLSYERGAKKRMASFGIDVKVFELPEDISQSALEREFEKINSDPGVHGIMIFRPLPRGLDDEPLRQMIDPRRDVDGMSPVNIAKVFSGDGSGFAPCTPEAVVEVLDCGGIDVTGRRVTVVGRSMVVGRPLAMLLLARSATVTICHTRTKDLAARCREADILVAAAGRAKMITAEYIGEGAAVIDVGINVGADGRLCGDVDFDSAAPRAGYITPVPGGVGAVTSSVLARHTLRAARMLTRS
jgi:methylenetetrahydrofolate dehydrogenase (NADP+)/methenyltetrahydrofolate cyclohydrolase